MSREITYGNVIVDIDTLPEKSLLALAHRGLRAYLGNEQSSKVTAWKDENSEASEAAVAAKRDEFVAEALQKLLDGTMGAGGSRGPRGTKIETLMRQIGEKRARIILKANGLTWPTKDKTVKFGNAEFDGPTLIQRQINAAKDSVAVVKYFGGKTVQEEAEAEMKAAERIESRVAKSKGEVGEDAEALGL